MSLCALWGCPCQIDIGLPEADEEELHDWAVEGEDNDAA